MKKGSSRTKTAATKSAKKSTTKVAKKAVKKATVKKAVKKKVPAKTAAKPVKKKVTKAPEPAVEQAPPPVKAKRPSRPRKSRAKPKTFTPAPPNPNVLEAGYTELVLLLDRSGSMSKIQAATQDNFNECISKQKSDPSPCAVTLLQFNHELQEVYAQKPLDKVPPLRMEPDGMTAYFDAVGKTICCVQDRLAKPEMADKQPGKVLFVIFTDGLDNQSKEYVDGNLNTLVTRKKSEGWEFLFLGVSEKSIQDAKAIGIPAENILQYSNTHEGTQAVYEAVNTSMLRARQRQSVGFTVSERQTVESLNSPSLSS